MFVTDLLGHLFSIPAIIFDRCIFVSHNQAFYNAYFGWTTVVFFRGITHHIMMFISYDRFLAVWFYKKFNTVTLPHVIKYRLLIMIFVLLSIYITFDCIFSKVICIENCIGHTNETRYLSIPGYKGEINSMFRELSLFVCSFMFSAIPSFGSAYFSVALIYALLMKKNKSSVKKNYSQIITVIVLNISYMCVSTPLLFIYVKYSLNEFSCYADIKTEISLAFLNTMTSIWSSANGLIIVMFNKDYRDEIISVFTSYKPDMNEETTC